MLSHRSCARTSFFRSSFPLDTVPATCEIVVCFNTIQGWSTSMTHARSEQGNSPWRPPSTFAAVSIRDHVSMAPVAPVDSLRLSRRGAASVVFGTLLTRSKPCKAEASDSELVQELLRKSRANKEKNDQQRLDRYYKREWAINKIVGKEVLPEPCDPRDLELGYKCRNLLPRTPEDKGQP